MKGKLLAASACAIAALAGYIWWQSSAITSIKASVGGRMVTVTAAGSGTVEEVLVHAGDTVTAGQVLFRLNSAAFAQDLAREQSRLAAIAETLPAEALALFASTQKAGEKTTATLAQLREEEEKARVEMEKASDANASASIALARLNSLQASGKRVDRAEQRNAAAEVEHTKTLLAEARKTHEKASYARALRETEERTPAASAAMASRMTEYQTQLDRVKASEQALETRRVSAPEAGRVLALGVQPGFAVEAGDAVITLAAEDKGIPWIHAFFPASAKNSLRTGQACDVTFTASGKALSGVISTLMPPTADTPTDTIGVRITLSLAQDTQHPPVGEAARVTVKLR